MKRRKKNNFPAKYVLLFMAIFCIIIIALTIRMTVSDTAVNTAVGYVIVPMQKGINRVGNGLRNVQENRTSRQKLLEENEELTEQLAEARQELNQVQIDQAELSALQELYDMDQSYADYDKVAASVIGKDTGNWFSTFLIDKGSNSGVEEGMNVIADGALAGVVTEVGPNYATIRSIVDDSSNISCKDLSTSELMMVSGSLQSMNSSSTILFSDLRDSEDSAQVGDQVVTSDISDIYLPNIPVGYITDISMDANNLTKSGNVAAIIDFSHLEKVFVILQTKDDLTEGGEE